MAQRVNDQASLFVVRATRSPVVEMSDWMILFGAVTARLRLTAAGQSTVTNDEHALESSGRMRSDVLQCVSALDQLHDMLAHTIDQRRGMERELHALRAELVALRQDGVVDAPAKSQPTQYAGA